MSRSSSPRWGTGHIPADPRTRYRAALDQYRRAESATYGTEITGQAFAAMAREEVWGWRSLEVVVGVVGGPLCGNEEVVTEVDPTPLEWAQAAEAVTARFRDSYTVRSRLDPYADWEREVADLRAGITL